MFQNVMALTARRADKANGAASVRRSLELRPAGSRVEIEASLDFHGTWLT
jgi:hypothetical protein